jgi:hypothetical protein
VGAGAVNALRGEVAEVVVVVGELTAVAAASSSSAVPGGVIPPAVRTLLDWCSFVDPARGLAAAEESEARVLWWLAEGYDECLVRVFWLGVS